LSAFKNFSPVFQFSYHSFKCKNLVIYRRNVICVHTFTGKLVNIFTEFSSPFGFPGYAHFLLNFIPAFINSSLCHFFYLIGATVLLNSCMDFLYPFSQQKRCFLVPTSTGNGLLPHFSLYFSHTFTSSFIFVLFGYKKSYLLCYCFGVYPDTYERQMQSYRLIRTRRLLCQTIFCCIIYSWCFSFNE
jgi:hypothetical protein